MLEPALVYLGLAIFAGTIPYAGLYRTPFGATPGDWWFLLFVPFIALAGLGVFVASTPRAFIADETGVRLIVWGRTVLEYSWAEIRAVRHGKVYARRLGTPRLPKLRPCPYLLIEASSEPGILVGTWQFTISKASVARATDFVVGHARDRGILVQARDYDPPMRFRAPKPTRAA